MSRYDEYKQECIEECAQKGMEGLTAEQAILVLQPEHGPENFMCDGEISFSQAMRNWKYKLKNSGLTDSQIRKAKKIIFG